MSELWDFMTRERATERRGSTTPLVRQLAALALASLGATALVLLRPQPDFDWMPWNLFLAWVPLGAAIVVTRARPGLVRVAATLVWLLFLPNAPYLVTDFVHLAHRTGVPYWYDLALFSAFALVGVALAVVSMRMIAALLTARIGPWTSRAAMFAVAWLASFGVYLGRFGRWNSWDVATRPLSLFADIFSSLAGQGRAEVLGFCALGTVGLLVARALFEATGGEPVELRAAPHNLARSALQGPRVVEPVLSKRKMAASK